jgi:hypothetical protein
MINEGTILILEQGSYDDHSFHGPYRVLQAIDEPKVFELYKEQWTAFAPDDLDDLDTDRFVKWLVSNRYIEPIDNAMIWQIDNFAYENKGPYTNLDVTSRAWPVEDSHLE